MTTQGLLDTSTVIQLGRCDPDTLPDEALISAVTLAELSVGSQVATSERVRVERQSHLQKAEASFVPIPFDAAAARAFALVAVSLRAAGRKTSARAFDALIAATSLSSGLPVYTFNVDDFAGIDGLEVHAVRTTS